MHFQKMYPGLDIKPDEVFVSDGSKCDIGTWMSRATYRRRKHEKTDSRVQAA
jgi:hypothetical protein